MNAPATNELPVVVIGAGPTGLAAAVHLIDRGIEPLVLEAGPTAATAVRDWAHVRLFSTWGEVVDPAAEKLLAPTGWTRPDPETYPSGGDWAEQYLLPLAAALGDRIRLDARVTGVSRTGRDRIVDADRDRQPFVVHFTHADGREERVFARAVIDASGTWSTPSPAGASGLPALGEKAAADRIAYRVPDLADPAVRARYAGRRTAVIGSGASAFTALASSPTSPSPATVREPRACGSFAGASPAPPSAAATPTSCPPAGRSDSRRRPPSRTGTWTRSPASGPRRSNATPPAASCWWARTDAARTRSTR